MLTHSSNYIYEHKRIWLKFVSFFFLHNLLHPTPLFWWIYNELDVNTVVNLRSSEHDIRFEDFFWNGSGDEPLTLSLKSNARLTAMNGFVGRETFIKTATVIATVYIDDSVIDKIYSIIFTFPCVAWFWNMRLHLFRVQYTFFFKFSM